MTEELILQQKHKVMKTYLITSILALLVSAGTMVKAQDRADDYLGLPGDNLNLYAVMNLFQESETLEAFERNLNEENSRINNLDLNGDNYVDYITVRDFPDGNVHSIVLQVALSPTEKQDVAVFTVEKLRDGAVQIQLIGDEALYGRNYIVEPIYDETPNPGYTGRRNQVETTTYVHVSAWPLVRYIYDPYYVTWHSSWYWGYYPSYWRPWSPCYYHYYYGYHYNYFPVYYSHYRLWHTPRWSHYHDNYYSRVRVYSPTVVVNINKGVYKTTYSRPESRRDGERLYATTHSSRSSNLSSTGSRRTSAAPADRSSSSGTTRRTEASAGRTVTRSTDGANTARRSTGTPSVNRSSGSTRESVSTRPSNSGVSRSSSGTVTNQTRSSSAKPAGSGVSRSSSASPAVSQSRSSSTSPAASQNRSSNSSAARSSAPAQTRSSEARSSAPSQKSSSARSSSGQSRSSSAARSSAPRQSSASAPSKSTRSSSSGSSKSSSSSGSSSRSSNSSSSRR